MKTNDAAAAMPTNRISRTTNRDERVWNPIQSALRSGPTSTVGLLLAGKGERGGIYLWPNSSMESKVRRRGRNISGYQSGGVRMARQLRPRVLAGGFGVYFAIVSIRSPQFAPGLPGPWCPAGTAPRAYPN